MGKTISLVLFLTITFSGLAQTFAQKAPLEVTMQVLVRGSLIPEGALVPQPVAFFIHPNVGTTLTVHAGETMTIDFFADGRRLTSAKAVWHDAKVPPPPPGQIKPLYMIPAQFVVPNYIWTNAPTGNHVLSIKAYGFHGLSASSASLGITVLPPFPRLPASGTNILTGKPRPALAPDEVKVSHTPPRGAYEVIGTVTIRVSGTWPEDSKDAIDELKKRGALIGANYVILDRVNHTTGTPFTAKNSMFVPPMIYLSGRAVYAPMSSTQ